MPKDRGCQVRPFTVSSRFALVRWCADFILGTRTGQANIIGFNQAPTAPIKQPGIPHARQFVPAMSILITPPICGSIKNWRTRCRYSNTKSQECSLRAQAARMMAHQKNEIALLDRWIASRNRIKSKRAIARNNSRQVVAAAATTNAVYIFFFRNGVEQAVRFVFTTGSTRNHFFRVYGRSSTLIFPRLYSMTPSCCSCRRLRSRPSRRVLRAYGDRSGSCA